MLELGHDTKNVDRHLRGPRVMAQMDPEKQPSRVFRVAITTLQLTGEGGAFLIVSALRVALGTEPPQEAV